LNNFYYYHALVLFSVNCLNIVIILVLVLAALGMTTLLAAQTASAQQQPLSPIMLEALSDQGTFRVEMAWTPADIGAGNIFGIRFIEPETNIELEDIRYDILLSRGDNTVQQLRKVDQTSLQQKFRFEEPGTYRIMINDIDGLDETVTIPIEVTPEFPAGAAALTAATTIGAAILFFAARRSNNNNLFRL
jgi:multidrug efflux pump subunit AcrA (membrane-fusion protein)